jgi:carboxyl-terminal processing protease
VHTLREGYGLKFTVARYYTPNGRSIQAQGIVPDIEVRQRFLDEDEEVDDEDGLVKEKDLKNHLEAYPFDDDGESEEEEEKDEDNQGKKKKSKRRKTESRYGPLDVETLKEDNQVMRALEILISHDIFKAMK